jgi:hypothetical protein
VLELGTANDRKKRRSKSRKWKNNFMEYKHEDYAQRDQIHSSLGDLTVWGA